MSTREQLIEQAREWALAYIRSGLTLQDAFMALCREHWLEVADLPTGPVWRWVKAQAAREGYDV